jgi:hypothetical protein
MSTLLEQVEALDFEDREKIVVALKKRPEKSKEDLMIDEIKSMRSALDNAEKKLNKRVESLFTLFFITLVCFYIFLLPTSSPKSGLRIL